MRIGIIINIVRAHDWLIMDMKGKISWIQSYKINSSLAYICYFFYLFLILALLIDYSPEGLLNLLKVAVYRIQSPPLSKASCLGFSPSSSCHSNHSLCCSCTLSLEYILSSSMLPAQQKKTEEHRRKVY